MARVRNIAPGFFTNEELVELPFEDRLLFAGLWTLADREGRLEDRPKRIRMAIFPCDNVDVDLGLQRLQKAGLVLRYTVQGVAYLAIPAFHKHQKPHPREAASVIPGPEGVPKADPPPPCNPPEGLPKANLGPHGMPPEGEPKADLGAGEPGGLSDSRTLGLSERGSLALAARPPEMAPSVGLAIEARKHGLQVTGSDPRLIAAAEQGVTPETLRDVIADCARRKGSAPSIGYVLATLQGWATDATRLSVVGAAAPARGGVTDADIARLQAKLEAEARGETDAAA